MIKDYNYTQAHILRENTGNNSFSYSERKKLLWKAEITIPSLIQGTIKDAKIGSHIAFEEIDHTGKLRQCTWLAQLIQWHYPPTQKPLYIIDNHNHALYFRLNELKNQTRMLEYLEIIHIDQHSDQAQTPHPIDKLKRKDQNYIRHYTNYTCNVGSFIEPFLELFPRTNYTWIKSESQLLKYQAKKTETTYTILDIDLDFRSPEMSIQNISQTINNTQTLMQKASLITIATSPYFLDQTHALRMLAKIII